MQFENTKAFEASGVHQAVNHTGCVTLYTETSKEACSSMGGETGIITMKNYDFGFYVVL